ALFLSLLVSSTSASPRNPPASSHRNLRVGCGFPVPIGWWNVQCQIPAMPLGLGQGFGNHVPPPLNARWPAPQLHLSSTREDHAPSSPRAGSVANLQSHEDRDPAGRAPRAPRSSSTTTPAREAGRRQQWLKKQ